ncbi:MAG TPA: ABC transporter ATP-binding protein [Candidatus Thermoplasmatota archaeon]|nr:ABC transporter ATP-binding protein [Candidatus Thermoplasmatota archaeon]
MPDAVLAEGLTKRYGELEAVRGVDFRVPAGTVYGFLGPNGAGKSSTMRMIYGLSPRTGGRLEVLGLDIARHGREVKRRIGVVPQESNLDADMTARENLVVFGRFYDLVGASLQRRVDELLEYVQLAEKQGVRAWELSGGMKRRLLIARALLHDPDLLVLDEPTTGLDPQSRSLLWERIRALRRQGKTVLLTTHYMDEAEKLADELVIMDGGRIIERGAPKALVERHVGREVAELTMPATEDARVLSRVGSAARAHERAGDELRLFADDGEAALEEALASGVKPERHLVRRATLEDVFLKLTGRRLSD